jgi:ribosomal protein S18 acetylase RimI-like enzyme
VEHVVRLQPFQREDLALIEPWFCDVETQRWLGGPDWPRLILDLADRPLGEFRGAWETGRFHWLAWVGDDPVGYLDCGTYDRRTTWNGEKVVGSIEVPSGALALTVAPACRRSGYGRRMLAALLEAPEVADIGLFDGGVEPENVPCGACLKSAGFRQQNLDADFEGMLYFVRDR